MSYIDVFYADGDEGTRIIDILTSADQPFGGATLETIIATVEYLSRWHPENAEILKGEQNNSRPAVTTFGWDGYTLIWNTHLGDIHLTYNPDYSLQDCILCGDPADYCTGHGADDATWDAARERIDAIIAKLEESEGE